MPKANKVNKLQDVLEQLAELKSANLQLRQLKMAE